MYELADLLNIHFRIIDWLLQTVVLFQAVTTEQSAVVKVTFPLFIHYLWREMMSSISSVIRKWFEREIPIAFRMAKQSWWYENDKKKRKKLRFIFH